MLKYFLGCCLLALSSFVFAGQQTWYFVRHFEKQLGDNPSLTEIGRVRAEALAAFFLINLLLKFMQLNTSAHLRPPPPLQFSKIYQ